VLRAPADPEELRAWVGERLARYKVPKAVEVADTLPRTASGKLLRRQL
jgi:acyl-CoA synthetase (AMP-forming)/AMP-acid ligase II